MLKPRYGCKIIWHYTDTEERSAITKVKSCNTGNNTRKTENQQALVCPLEILQLPKTKSTA